MERDLEKRLEDCSTEDEFQFQISCMCCNSIWKSSKRTFDLKTKEPIDDKKKIIYKAVYEREKRFVQERVGKEVYKDFNYCVICKRWVCDNCFLICDELDMCKECAERLEEKGYQLYNLLVKCSERMLEKDRYILLQGFCYVPEHTSSSHFAT